MISVIIGLIFVSIMTLIVYLIREPVSDNASEPYPRLQAFELVKHDGSPFSLVDIKEHWNLVFFGYMNCPDVCPATMMQLKHAYDQIQTNASAMPLP
ncbi:MAG: SCO family protein, partial [Granulosicoccaceae bacterium]